MTADTFARLIKVCLSKTHGISWNSVNESKLRALGRSFERHQIDVSGVIDELRSFLPSGTIDRDTAKIIEKTIR